MKSHIDKIIDKLKSEGRITYVNVRQIENHDSKEKVKRILDLFKKISKFLFMEYVDKGNNCIVGPGYHNYGYFKISYGKISIILTIILTILIIYLVV